MLRPYSLSRYAVVILEDLDAEAKALKQVSSEASEL